MWKARGVRRLECGAAAAYHTLVLRDLLQNYLFVNAISLLRSPTMQIWSFCEPTTCPIYRTAMNESSVGPRLHLVWIKKKKQLC